MKFPLMVAFLLLPLAAFGRETAYQALRTVGAQRSTALLNNVIEVKGRNGAPQPASWTILLNDPLARGGVREIEVAGGHIVSERTPVKTYGGQGDGVALNFKKLNLDSEGAFSLAEGEARAAKIGFYGADYLLRCDDAGGAPFWVVELLDSQQHSLGSVRIAADTGAVISKTFEGVTSKGSWAAGGGMRGRLIRFSDAMGRSFQHLGDKMEEFWTGEDPASKGN
ncbi:MAG: hypothetical protein WCH57_10960 [Verrucomicrobiota bacterium]